MTPDSAVQGAGQGAKPSSAQETAEKGEAADESTSPWASAVERYRETGKWAIGAFAVIGGLLAGTAPLAGIGNLEPGNRTWIVWGAILGLTGALAAIGAHVATLVPRTVYWHEIRPKKQRWFLRTFTKLGPLEDILASETKRRSVLPPGIGSPSKLAKGIENLRARVEEERRIQDDPSQKALAKKAAARAEERLTSELQEQVDSQRELLRIARFEKARTGFRVAFVAMVFGAILAGGGLGMLLYGLSDQTALRKATAEARKLEAEATKAEAEVAPLLSEGDQTSTPSDVLRSALPTSMVLLSEEGRSALGEQLGQDCDTEAPIPIAVLAGNGETGSWDVVVLGQTNCALLRFNLEPSLGSLVD